MHESVSEFTERKFGIRYIFPMNCAVNGIYQ